MKIKIKFSLGNTTNYIDSEIPALSRVMAQAKLESLLPGSRFLAFSLVPEDQAPVPVVEAPAPKFEPKKKPFTSDEPK